MTTDDLFTINDFLDMQELFFNLNQEELLRERISNIESATEHLLYKHLVTEPYDIKIYLCEGYSISEMRYISKIRAEMIPLLGKPWADPTGRICKLCNLGVNEDTLHFFRRMPRFRRI